jgi:hypothetical protein
MRGLQAKSRTVLREGTLTLQWFEMPPIEPEWF